MSRRFSQVPLSLWRRPEFKSLTVTEKLAVLFFWAGPHSTSAGIGVVPDAYAIADLGFTIDEWKAAREAIELAGFIMRDEESETVLVKDYLTSNRPTNVRHRAAVASQINSIECDELRDYAVAEFNEIDAAATKPAPAAPQPNGYPKLAETSDASPRLMSKLNGFRGAA